jgi:rSAM/selenodomain-associated transferase 1
MAYQFPNSVLLIFCKAPIPGQVKTRLTPPLSQEQAAQVHIELSENIFRLARDSALCPIQLWCSPTTEHPYYKKVVTNFNFSLQTQKGSDLGARMHHAFTTTLKEFNNVILIGCDCPSLTQGHLQEALSALNSNQIVLAPAEDGGYVLIGLDHPQEQLLTEMPWGTSSVLPITRTRIAKSKLRFFELSEQWDVDTIDDLLRYRDHRLNL